MVRTARSRGQRLGQALGQRAVVVQRHRLGPQPEGPDEVEGRREPGVVHGHPVPGPQVGLEDATPSSPADHGQPGHRDAVGLQLGAGQGGQLGQDRVLAVQVGRRSTRARASSSGGSSAGSGPPWVRSRVPGGKAGGPATGSGGRSATAVPPRPLAVTTSGPQPPVGGRHRGRADPEPAEPADGRQPVAGAEAGQRTARSTLSAISVAVAPVMRSSSGSVIAASIGNQGNGAATHRGDELRRPLLGPFRYPSPR